VGGSGCHSIGNYHGSPQPKISVEGYWSKLHDFKDWKVFWHR